MSFEVACGFCGALSPLVLEVQLPKVSRKQYRCPACAWGEPVPDLSQPLPASLAQSLPDRMTAIGALSASFNRPSPKAVLVKQKRQVYKGEPAEKPGPKLTAALPWYDR